MRKKKDAQFKLINELKSQLMVQAERLGIRDQYTPMALKEMSLEVIGKILMEFYMERSNLEYELNLAGSDKKELLIKLERLNVYIRTAEARRASHMAKYEQLLEQGMGDIDLTQKAVRLLKPGIKVQAAA